MIVYVGLPEPMQLIATVVVSQLCPNASATQSMTHRAPGVHIYHWISSPYGLDGRYVRWGEKVSLEWRRYSFPGLRGASPSVRPRCKAPPRNPSTFCPRQLRVQARRDADSYTAVRCGDVATDHSCVYTGNRVHRAPRRPVYSPRATCPLCKPAKYHLQFCSAIEG